MTDELTKDQLAKEYKDNVFVQDYTKKAVIEGVVVKELKNMVGEDGDFSELVRVNPQGEVEGFPQFKIAQVNRSKILPHAIKAWHVHLKQDEIQHMLPENLFLVGLLDMREDSPTKGISMRLVLGGGKAQLLYIPKGVAHGYKNLSKKAGTILYFVSEQFTIDDPDELRLPWDTIGADFWEAKKE
ncbi:MAG: dTDP-4-dehydrorhamnose 3,5-epimerase family protein [Candidatus Levyibacteriota bacterium]